MGKNSYTIFLKKTDLDFIEKEVGIKGVIKFKDIKQVNGAHYKIRISESELDSFAQLCAHSCDCITSDRKARRLDNIALMLESYLEGF